MSSPDGGIPIQNGGECRGEQQGASTDKQLGNRETANQQWCHLTNENVTTRIREKRPFVFCLGCRLTCQPVDVLFLLTPMSRRQKTPTGNIW